MSEMGLGIGGAGVVQPQQQTIHVDTGHDADFAGVAAAEEETFNTLESDDSATFYQTIEDQVVLSRDMQEELSNAAELGASQNFRPNKYTIELKTEEKNKKSSGLLL